MTLDGAGKTTTFRMLCGLLPPTHGTLRVAGVDLHSARAAARQQLGYVAQKFALYGDLSVAENLDFFASAYGLRGARRRERIAWALEQFELEPLMRQPSGLLPGGYKQRLAMAAALLHEPEIFHFEIAGGKVVVPHQREAFLKRVGREEAAVENIALGRRRQETLRPDVLRLRRGATGR